MGDRARVIFTDSQESSFSPVVYLHWGGSYVPDLIAELAQYMRGRKGDIPYAAARFVGLCHTHTPGNLSLGIWNLEGRPEDELAEDAGIVVVNVDNFSWRAFGGYLPANG